MKLSVFWNSHLFLAFSLLFSCAGSASENTFESSESYGLKAVQLADKDIGLNDFDAKVIGALIQGGPHTWRVELFSCEIHPKDAKRIVYTVNTGEAGDVVKIEVQMTRGTEVSRNGTTVSGHIYHKGGVTAVTEYGRLLRIFESEKVFVEAVKEAFEKGETEDQ